MYDAEKIRSEITPEIRQEMIDALAENDGIPKFLKDDSRFIEVWVSGSFSILSIVSRSSPAFRSSRLKNAKAVASRNITIIL